MGRAAGREVGVALFCLALLAPLPAAAQPLSPRLCGQNAWLPNVYGGQLDSLWGLVQASGPKIIRIGGNQYNKAPPTAQQYVALIQQIRNLGAEPIVQVSAYGTAAEAASLVAAVNGQLPTPVLYWSIGNEPDMTDPSTGQREFTAAGVAAYMRSHAAAMKTVAPAILVFGPEYSWFRQAEYESLFGGGGADDISGTDANGRAYVDVVTFHRYPFGATYTRAQVVAAAAGLRTSAAALAARLQTVNQGRPAAPLRWGLTEFNVTYHNPPTTDPEGNTLAGVGVHSFLNGQHFAEVFGVGMEHAAFCMTPWSIHESGGDRDATDFGYLDGPAGSAEPRSSYYHLQMIAQSFAGDRAAATSNVALVKAIAARDGARIVVMLLNEDQAADYAYTIKLAAGAVSGTTPLKVTVDAGVPVEHQGAIAAQSTVLLVFSASGELRRRTTYGLESHAALHLPPTTEVFAAADAGMPDDGPTGDAPAADDASGPGDADAGEDAGNTVDAADAGADGGANAALGGGCGCRAATGPGAGVLGLLASAMLLRRRRRHR